MSDRRFMSISAPILRMRGPIGALVLSASLLPQALAAAQAWSASVAVTSDYLVRGISRSNHRTALQADLDVVTDGGFIGGLFASNTQLDADAERDAELSALIGFAWQASRAWRAKVFTSYYVYPWNDAGSHYNYAELAIEAAYNDWLDLDAAYSPDTPRYVEYRGLISVTAKSLEANVHTPWRHHVAATAGLGYSELSGPEGGGYTFWSAGGIIDLAPWSISIGYADTGAKARSLFYGAAAHDRWTATVIRRF